MAEVWKRVKLKDPITGEYLAPMGGDGDSLGGKPASDYVTNDILDEKLEEIDQNITNITNSVTTVTEKVYPVSDFSDDKTTVFGENTITETGADYVIETTFVSDTQIVQVLTYDNKQYTKTINITESEITETVEVTEL